MKRSLLTLLPLIVLLALAALLADRLYSPRVTGSIDSPLIGMALPDLGFKNLPEGPFILNFFASWCAPCAIEHPHLMQLEKDGVALVGVVFKDTPENIRKLLKARGDPYTEIFYDDGSGAGTIMGITGVPENYAIDAHHIVRARLQGPLEDPDVIKTFLKALKT